MKECWDCKTMTDDFVMESRQVSGGDGVVYAGDFRDVPVHANRRDCQAAQKKQIVDWKRANIPFYDVPAC